MMKTLACRPVSSPTSFIRWGGSLDRLCPEEARNIRLPIMAIGLLLYLRSEQLVRGNPRRANKCSLWFSQRKKHLNRLTGLGCFLVDRAAKLLHLWILLQRLRKWQQTSAGRQHFHPESLQGNSRTNLKLWGISVGRHYYDGFRRINRGRKRALSKTWRNLALTRERAFPKCRSGG